MAIAKPDLDDSMRLRRIASVPQVIENEGPTQRHCREDFARPLQHQVGRTHDEGRIGLAIRVRNSDRHQRLTGAALSDQSERVFGLEILRSAGDGHRLSGKRLTQQGLQSRCDWVFRSLQRRK